MRLQTNVYLVRAGEAIQAAAETEVRPPASGGHGNERGLLAPLHVPVWRDALPGRRRQDVPFCPPLRLRGGANHGGRRIWSLIQYGQLVDWVDGDGAKGVTFSEERWMPICWSWIWPELGRWPCADCRGGKPEEEPVVSRGEE